MKCQTEPLYFSSCHTSGFINRPLFVLTKAWARTFTSACRTPTNPEKIKSKKREWESQNIVTVFEKRKKNMYRKHVDSVRSLYIRMPIVDSSLTKIKFLLIYKDILRFLKEHFCCFCLLYIKKNCSPSRVKYNAPNSFYSTSLRTTSTKKAKTTDVFYDLNTHVLKRQQVYIRFIRERVGISFLLRLPLYSTGYTKRYLVSFFD